MMNKNTYQQIYTLQKKIRYIEKTISKKYHENQMRCPTHLSLGQEAIAAATGLALKKSDISVSYHRSHAHYLGKGGNVRKMLAELYGFKEGCSKGVGGSMHLVDLKCNFYGSTAIVSNSIPIGVGIAYSMKINNIKNLVCIYIGDASIEEGVFFESINFCALKKLPVVFICENNFFSVYTHLKVRQPQKSKIYKVAKAMGVTSYKFSQNNPFKLYSNVKKIFDKVRKNPKTYFIEVETYRYLEHCGPNDDSALGYRDLKEIAKWKRKDPIEFSRNYLIKNKIFSRERIDKFNQKMTQEINKDFQYIKKLRRPQFKNIKNLAYKIR